MYEIDYHQIWNIVRRSVISIRQLSFHSNSEYICDELINQFVNTWTFGPNLSERFAESVKWQAFNFSVNRIQCLFILTLRNHLILTLSLWNEKSLVNSIINSSSFCIVDYRKIDGKVRLLWFKCLSKRSSCLLWPEWSEKYSNLLRLIHKMLATGLTKTSLFPMKCSLTRTVIALKWFHWPSTKIWY